ncbi:MAG: TATA-box-binding protein [Nanoarchaeota archaeon]|nr:TATA-box-binding protein [Nanoarchaeota archaeon]MBU4451585.1 TATA-box-binding protein [Nanoarchaeota archaeon]MCG2724337.1 TATA-box-binding protein [archaeon]
MVTSKKTGKVAQTKEKIAPKTSHNIKIQNVVISVDTGTRMLLDVLARHLENAEYEPESFPGLVYRIKEPKASTLIFTTGKIICSGAKSFDEAKLAITKLIKKFREIGLKVPSEPKTEIVNIVASAELGARLDLNKIVFELGECEYEPEQFPGLVYRLDSPKVVFLIFNSGKLVCTGARSEKAVELAVDNLRKKLKDIKAM